MNTAQIRKQAKDSINGKHFKASMIFLLSILFNIIVGLVPIIGLIFIIVMSIPLTYGLIYSFIKLKRNENVGYFDFISIAFSEFGNAWRVAFSMLGKIWPYLVGYIGGIFLILITSIVTLILTASNNLIESSSITSLTNFIPVIIICIIGGIISIVCYILLLLKSLYYSLSFYVLYDNKELKGKEIVEKSKDLMTKNRWNLIKMQIPYYLIIMGIDLLIAIALSCLSIIFKLKILTSLTNFISYIPMIFIMPLIQFAITEFYDTLTHNGYENITNFNINPIVENISDTNITSRKGFSIASLILGIISLLTFCFIPLSILCGILSIIFGFIGLFRGGKGLGIAGLITGFLGMILSIIITVIGIGYSLNNFVSDRTHNTIDIYEIEKQKEENLLDEFEKKFNNILQNQTNSVNTNNSSSSDNKLTLKNSNIKFNIPTNYKVSNSYNYTSSSSKYFNNNDYTISVNCNLDSYNTKTEKEYLENQVKYDKNKSNYWDLGTKTITINNKKISYIIWEYENYGHKTKKISAIYTLPNNYVYTVNASTYDDNTILDLNTIKDFITIE